MIAKNSCKIDGCYYPAKTRGYCHNHYQQWLRHGEPRLIPRKKVVRLCSVDGCGIIHQARGYCSQHYRQFMKYGYIPDYIPSPDCEICGKPHYSKGLCKKCYHTQYNKENWRKYKHGKEDKTIIDNS